MCTLFTSGSTCMWKWHDPAQEGSNESYWPLYKNYLWVPSMPGVICRAKSGNASFDVARRCEHQGSRFLWTPNDMRFHSQEIDHHIPSSLASANMFERAYRGRGDTWCLGHSLQCILEQWAMSSLNALKSMFSKFVWQYENVSRFIWRDEWEALLKRHSSGRTFCKYLLQMKPHQLILETCDCWIRNKNSWFCQ